jgi:lysophospholipase L1-like esterase
MLAAMTFASPLAAAPLRLLPLGDSITQGGGKHDHEYSYRWPLFQMLVDEGIEVEFIGSMNRGLNEKPTVWPSTYKDRPFSNIHEGHYGWKTGKILTEIPGWMPQWQAPPDIALIHLGTNDQKSDNFQRDIIDAHEGIIRLLREKNPRMVILVGQLFFHGEPATSFRLMVAAMVERLHTPESPVIAVNHFEGFQPDPGKPETDTFDWAHPNPQGQRKMAECWLQAMRPFLPRS